MFELIQGIISVVLFVEAVFVDNKILNLILVLFFGVALFSQGIYTMFSKKHCKFDKYFIGSKISKGNKTIDFKYCPICGQKLR